MSFVFFRVIMVVLFQFKDGIVACPSFYRGVRVVAFMKILCEEKLAAVSSCFCSATRFFTVCYRDLVPQQDANERKQLHLPCKSTAVEVVDESMRFDLQLIIAKMSYMKDSNLFARGTTLKLLQTFSKIRWRIRFLNYGGRMRGEKCPLQIIVQNSFEEHPGSPKDIFQIQKDRVTSITPEICSYVKSNG